MHTKFIIMKKKEEARSGKKDKEWSLTSNNIVVIFSIYKCMFKNIYYIEFNKHY